MVSIPDYGVTPFGSSNSQQIGQEIDMYNKYMLNQCNNKDIPFIDIHEEVFSKQKNPLELFPFELKKHYNVLGFKKTSEGIYRLTKD